MVEKCSWGTWGFGIGSRAMEDEDEEWADSRSQTSKKYLANKGSGRGWPLIRIRSLTAQRWGEV